MERTLDDLVQRFRDRTLPKSEWTHDAHLAVGMWHVANCGPWEALDLLRTGIRALNDAHGVANSETSGYHETITSAYVALLSMWCDAHPFESAAVRLSSLRQSPVAEPEVLLRFYSRNVLFSPAARAGWVKPDLGPLRLTALGDKSTGRQ
jgi:hypothetical protein